MICEVLPRMLSNKATATKITTAIISLIFASTLYAIDFENEAIVRIDSNLYEATSSGTKVTSTLKSGANVTILARKNAWYEVKYSPVMQKGVLQGWLPMRNLQLKVGSGFPDYFKKILNPVPVRKIIGTYGDEDMPGNEPEATTVRGLSSLRFADVEPDEAAVQAMDKYAVNKKQAGKFASKLGLKTRTIKYLVRAESENIQETKQPEGEEDF